MWTDHSQGRYCRETCRRLGWRVSWNGYTARNRSELNAYHRNLYRKNAVEVIARTKAYQKTERGRLAAKINGIRQRKKFPEKHAARQEVLKAVRRGDLVKQPCWCGNAKVEAHHLDYSRPLDVVWLCAPCHRLEHQ